MHYRRPLLRERQNFRRSSSIAYTLHEATNRCGHGTYTHRNGHTGPDVLLSAGKWNVRPRWKRLALKTGKTTERGIRIRRSIEDNLSTLEIENVVHRKQSGRTSETRKHRRFNPSSIKIMALSSTQRMDEDERKALTQSNDLLPLFPALLRHYCAERVQRGLVVIHLQYIISRGSKTSSSYNKTMQQTRLSRRASPSTDKTTLGGRTGGNNTSSRATAKTVFNTVRPELS